LLKSTVSKSGYNTRVVLPHQAINAAYVYLQKLPDTEPHQWFGEILMFRMNNERDAMGGRAMTTIESKPGP